MGHGIGIPTERFDELFEEFKRLATPVAGNAGLGLGLAIVERIARRLGLPVTVRSSVGRGSCFAVGRARCRRLPAAPGGVDFVIVDYHLAGALTGLDAIYRVAHLQHRPVAAVVVTADRSAEIKLRVTGRGYWLLDKPLRVERLRSLMSHVLP